MAVDLKKVKQATDDFQKAMDEFQLAHAKLASESETYEAALAEFNFKQSAAREKSKVLHELLGRVDLPSAEDATESTPESPDDSGESE